MKSSLPSLAAWLVATFAAGTLGALGSLDAPTFYAQLNQPSWAPPAWLFGPVWTVLYAMMGVAAWMVWRSPGPRALALTLFAAQLAANALWSWIFFAWRLGALATVEVLVLLALIVATLVAFLRIRRAAGLLLVPYLAWVGFASVLTAVMWRLNPGAL